MNYASGGNTDDGHVLAGGLTARDKLDEARALADQALAEMITLHYSDVRAVWRLLGALAYGHPVALLDAFDTVTRNDARKGGQR